MTEAVFDLLASRIETPLVLLDVGGHGGALEGWKKFGDRARVLCFEARSDEANNLAAENTDGNIEYVPLGLSNDGAPIEVNVAAAAGCSSAFPPIENLYRRYLGCSLMRPVAKVSCPTTTVDAYLDRRGIDAVHGIKLDTQGFELRILQGAEKALRDCQFILVETEFNPMYEGQPLFGDIDKFLRERGFVLWRFHNFAHYPTSHIGGEPHRILIGAEPGGHQLVDVPNGQLFWADAFYVRRSATAICDDPLERDLAIAGAALVSQWNFNDLAIEMIRKSGDGELLTQVQAALGQSFVEETAQDYPADMFLSQQLTRDGAAWRTDFATTDACVIYGPYVRLPYGPHEVTFHVEADGLGNVPLASEISFQVAADTVTFNSVELIGAGGADCLRTGAVKVSFYNTLPNGRYEFRISTRGRPFDGTLVFKGASLQRLTRWRH